MRAIRRATARQPAAPALLLLLLVLLAVAISSVAGGGIGGGGLFKSTPPRVAVGRPGAWDDATAATVAVAGRASSGSSNTRGRHPHRQQRQQQRPPSSSPAAAFHLPTPQGLQRRVLALNNGTRLALAGALAGGFSNLVLYPIDLAKTLRQAGSATASATLRTQARAYGFLSLWAGLTPAILGSMPSSALYFGVYEQVKRRLGDAVARRQQHQRQRLLREGQGKGKGGKQQQGSLEQLDFQARRANILRRWGVHAVAAAAGNTASSLIFVPKEVLKQQLQTYRSRGGAGAGATLPHVLGQILRERGIRGLYSGYRATLLRNIPSAILRFALYEEFKLFINGHDQASEWLRAHNAHIVAGALAGAISSAVTTPLDVVKTRMAINACPAGGDVLSCLVSVAQREGVPGLYAGLGFRVLYSALFTAVGFTSFEASKALLGVQDPPPPGTVGAGAGAGGKKR